MNELTKRKRRKEVEEGRETKRREKEKARRRKGRRLKEYMSPEPSPHSPL